MTNDKLDAFLRGEGSHLCQETNGTWCLDRPGAEVLLCGSFNPVHHGHRRLAEVAAGRVGKPVAFELSVVNADKPPIEAEELRRRLAQFAGWTRVYATRAWGFEAKSELFPGAVFVVGADTAVRIVDPRYYRDDPARRDRSLAVIRDRGCRFLVAGRVDDAGRFRGLDGVSVPAGFEGMFEGLSETEFRADVSSTAIRQARERSADGQG